MMGYYLITHRGTGEEFKTEARSVTQLRRSGLTRYDENRGYHSFWTIRETDAQGYRKSDAGPIPPHYEGH